MDAKDFIELAKQIVVNYFNEQTKIITTEEDICVVWQCKTLQNNKALLINNLSHGVYFEVTYNGDRDEIYVDIYEKIQNHKYMLGTYEALDINKIIEEE